MEKMIIVSDFDGTITQKDSLYYFFDDCALEEWQEVEKLWIDKQISSKECLIQEFNLVPNLSQKLINDYVKTLDLDSHFKKFLSFIQKNNLDFVVVSDGIDYFINSIFKNNDIENINIISNHGEFNKDEFKISFPNDYKKCTNDAGTCKCKVVENLREKYETIIYIGDGASDFCVANKADYLFAKKNLSKYCDENNIKYIKYQTYNDVIETISKMFLQ